MSIASKAFYTVTAVYIDGALGGGSTISLGTTDVFGLPYLVNDFGDVTSIGWNTSSDMTSPIHVTDDAVDITAQALTSLGLFVPAVQTSPATAITGDVRGLYWPSSISDGAKRLRFTSYVQGADVWLNQLASMQHPQGGGTVPPLTSTQLYGQPQFYTGRPS